MRRVAIAILHYLRDHPAAKDSARGIAKWWVSEERDVVEKALMLLVKEGVIEKPRHFYQLSRGMPLSNRGADLKKALRRLQPKKQKKNLK